MPEFYSLEEVAKHHKEIIWPTVRIRSQSAWGSGTVIYSKPDKTGKYHTYVVTCHHVIADSIKVVTEWDQRVGMDAKREIRTPVEVQFFYYENYSYARGLAFSCRAHIRCYDAKQDIALLELERFESPAENVAFLYPEKEIAKVHVFDPVYACGAALAHEPIATKGIINFMNEIIDDFEYWMATAQIIFGNSGGSIYRYSDERKRFEFLGMPAAIAVNASGFSADPITHMGYFVPVARIYRVLRDNSYHFIFEEKISYEDCEAERNKKAEEDKQLYMARFGGAPKSGSSDRKGHS